MAGNGARHRRLCRLGMVLLTVCGTTWGGSSTVLAQATGIREDAPQRYTVVRGDTLWDIAGRFLHSPWQWPEVWQDNPDIHNPHRIYPGDTVTLSDVDGAPRLRLERGQGEVVRLSPGVRRVPHREAIATIPLEQIQPFLEDYRIVEADTPPALAHVVAGDNQRILSGAGDRLYARGQFPQHKALLGIYRQGQRYVDAASGEVLGLELQTVGQARLVEAQGEVGVLEVQRASREIRNGDIVLPLPANPVDTQFQPRSPDVDVSGHLLAVPEGLRYVGRFDVVTLDRGARDGLRPGHVLSVAQAGERVTDPVNGERLQLPDEDAGLVMVFRTFDRVSYALVMQAHRSLSVGDRIHRPAETDLLAMRGAR
ncbi:LysM peptidoglycan-binding domain-containing protein [Halomonas shantousis]